MAKWKCTSCGEERESRCKPKKCKSCGGTEFVKEEEESK